MCGTDPHIQCVKDNDLIRMSKSKSSIIGDAIRYAKQDFDITFEHLENGFSVSVDKEGVVTSTSNKLAVKRILKVQEVDFLLQEVSSSDWQGVILNNRYKDELLIKNAFTWLINGKIVL